ncbi:MAG: NAD-dependent epimerase/dehydratase family protein [Rickettsiales bacterium]|jgi:nucleoside-diphosphate-sugar epimerase|nr:NAD-dependent epimerase/dehydratase family protein [Rickettsiales bacterium]
MQKILITGASGQIGADLVVELRSKYGKDNVIASDIKLDRAQELAPFEVIDVLDKDLLKSVIVKYEIDTIFHLASLLSATGEKNPTLCWNVNMGGLHNILELGRELKLEKIINVSSIAVFGPTSPKEHTPQATVIEPKTMYGITKLSGELLCDYYVEKFGMDIRGLRYPGIISSKTLPGGGTTDYAVEIFYDAITKGSYECFLKEDTILPFMYIDDTIRGTIELAEADFSKLHHYSNFNFSAASFSCGELAHEIQKHIPEFTITYKPDFRQNIADSWPRSIDDNAARVEWNWKEHYGLAEMTKDMLDRLTVKLLEEA